MAPADARGSRREDFTSLSSYWRQRVPPLASPGGARKSTPKLALASGFVPLSSPTEDQDAGEGECGDGVEGGDERVDRRREAKKTKGLVMPEARPRARKQAGKAALVRIETILNAS